MGRASRSRRDAHRTKARELARAAGINKPSAESLRARHDFAYFCEYVTRHATEPLTPASHHLEWHQQLITENDSKCLLRIAGANIDLLAPRGSAKAQPLDVKILTVNGWKEMRHLSIGDMAIAVDGVATPITKIHPQGIKDCYKVTFTDGTSTECSDDHLWSVRNLAGGDTRAYKTLTLNHIRTKVFVGTKKISHLVQETIYRDATSKETPWLDYRGYAKYHIPMVEPVQYPKKDLPINPYLVGILIGDGSLSTGSARFSKENEETIDCIKAVLPKGYKLSKVKHGTYNIIKDELNLNTSSKIIADLKSIKLWGCKAQDKFIPQMYLESCVEDRIALLQGLMDSDGTVGTNSKGGGNLSYSTCSKELKENVATLVQSLGGVATHHKPKIPFYTTADGQRKPGQINYRIGIKLPAIIKPFRSSYRGKHYTPCTKLTPTRGITNIEYVGTKEMQCITIAHPSHLYVTNNYIVTHNSTVLGLFTAWIIGTHTLAKRILQILYLSYSLSAARAKSETIKNIIESPEYAEIFPTVKPGSKWSNDYWRIDYKFAGIKSTGSEMFTMVCAGLGGSIVSKRSHVILIDDAIKSTDQIANPAIREKMERNWSTTVRPTLLEGGRVICLGTRFRPDDIHNTTFTPAKGWVQIEQRALIENPDGTMRSYWPAMWSLEYLLGLKKDDEISFSFQFMNLVVRINELGLNPDWIYFGDIPESFESYAVGIDLASSLKQKADFTVMTLIGRANGKFYVLDYRRMKVQGNIEKLDALLELYDEWNEPGIPFTVFVESVAYQNSFKGDFITYIVNEKEIYDMQCIPWIMKGDKLAHLLSVTGIYGNGAVIYNRYKFHSKSEHIVELTDFGSVSRDDCMDSTIIALQGMGARRKLLAV